MTTTTRAKLAASAALTAGFLATIVAANYVTTYAFEHGDGLVPVGFGLTATAGTYFAGLAFVLRDALQDAAGRRAVWIAIICGASLSFALAAPQIALASACAFALSETADLAVYTPLRARGYVRAAVASNVAGALVDTVVFLTIAGIPLGAALAGQMVGKLWVTLAVVAAVAALRLRRQVAA